MKKSIALVVVLSFAALAGCAEESVGEKIERGVRNAADDVEDAVDELK